MAMNNNITLNDLYNMEYEDIFTYFKSLTKNEMKEYYNQFGLEKMPKTKYRSYLAREISETGMFIRIANNM